jgi:hypothetical protein
VTQCELLAKLLKGYGAIVASFAALQGSAPNGKLYWISGSDPTPGAKWILWRERALADAVRRGTTVTVTIVEAVPTLA